MLLAQIESFLAVARSGSVSRAADQLFVTQPALSARLAALEAELGMALFERTGRGMRLSASGRAFLPFAEQALAALEEGRDTLRRLGNPESRLVLGTTPGVSAYTLPAVLERLSLLYPHLDITVRTGHTDDVLALVLRDEVQIGIGRAVRHPEIQSTPLYRDELVLVAAVDHDWGLLDAITLSGIGAERLILFDRESSYYELTNALFRTAGITSLRTMELDNIEAAKRMVERGLGVALLPRAAVLRDVAERRLRLIPVEGGLPVHREIAAFRRRDAAPRPAVTALLEVATALIGPEGQVPPPSRSTWPVD